MNKKSFLIPRYTNTATVMLTREIITMEIKDCAYAEFDFSNENKLKKSNDTILIFPPELNIVSGTTDCRINKIITIGYKR